MLKTIQDSFLHIMEQLVVLNSQVVLFAILVSIVIILLDSFHLVAKRKRNKSGLSHKAQTYGLDGSKLIPIKNYVSEIQGLAGRPDAMIIEGGYVIPVERKPLAKKLRDRYVAQILVYMRLIEEFEGKKPPYGYLILGPKCRRVKISNTEKRQEWLQGQLDEMRSILDGNPSTPTPHPRKCQRCDVRDHCQSKTENTSQIVNISNT